MIVDDSRHGGPLAVAPGARKIWSSETSPEIFSDFASRASSVA